MASDPIPDWATVGHFVVIQDGEVRSARGFGYADRDEKVLVERGIVRLLTFCRAE